VIRNDREYRAALDRIAYFQEQITQLRRMETNPVNYRLSVGGYLDELDRMNLDIREYLWLHPADLADAAAPRAT
jgi:hypothetical protein